jgi:CHASE2 domain-containing sensor protein
VIEFVLFVSWLSYHSREGVRKGDGASAFMILLLCLPVVVTILAPYLVWCAFRDRGYNPLVAGTAFVAVVLVATYGLLEGLWWQTVVATMVAGALGLLGVLWTAYRRERREAAESSDGSAPRWRFS